MKQAYFFKFLSDKADRKYGKKCIIIIIKVNMKMKNLDDFLLIKSYCIDIFKEFNFFQLTIHQVEKLGCFVFIQFIQLLNFDRKMKIENEKALLFINNFTSRNYDIKLNFSRYLPPNKTYLLQPIDQDCIQNFKMNYRK